MAKDYSPHQQRIIRNYYRNREAIETQRLQELVTEIYLAGAGRKADRLWERVAALLERAEGLDAEIAGRIVSGRDVEALAELAGSRFG
jgi:hypothetical protein